MNAPARISQPRDAYLPVVAQLLPGCAGEELEYRAAIMVYRDVASLGSGDHEYSQPLLNEIHRIAALAPTRSASLEELKAIRRCLQLMARAYAELEAVSVRG